VSENLDLVRSIYATWARRDYDWTDWADPAIDFLVADGPSPGNWTGLAGIWEGWRAVLSPSEDWRAKDIQYREIDQQRGLAVMRFSGRGKTSGLDVAQMGGTGANVFQIRVGKMIKVVIYWSRDRALADTGLGE
jgi:hypothetical protein